jgi:hypothetical protein
LLGLTSKPGEVQDRMSGSWEHKTWVLGSMFVNQDVLSTVTEESWFDSWQGQQNCSFLHSIQTNFKAHPASWRGLKNKKD